MSKLIAILSMIATLAIVYGLDRWEFKLKNWIAEDFNIYRSIWGLTAANLLIAGTWAILSWLVLNRVPRSHWVGVIFLVIGIVLFLFVPLQMIAPEGFQGILLFDASRNFLAALLSVRFTSRFTLSAAFIAVLGAVSFLPRKDRDQASR